MFKQISLSGVSVLVTGATGFVGTHLCRALAEQQAIVHATSRNEQAAQGGEVVWWQSELESQAAVNELLERTKAEIVFHLAGFVSASQARETVQLTFESLLQSSLYFLQAATDGKCKRLILTGSLNEPVGGVDAVPNSPYSAAKWMSSGYARMFHKLYGTPVVIVRLFMGYGPGQPAAKVIPSIIGAYLRGEAPRLTGGAFTTDWVFIDDIVSGLLAAAATPGVEGETFDLASGQTASVKEIACLLQEEFGSPLEPTFGAFPDRVAEHSREPDLPKSLQGLGWEPRTELRDGLRQMVEWQRNQVQRALKQDDSQGSREPFPASGV